MYRWQRLLTIILTASSVINDALPEHRHNFPMNHLRASRVARGLRFPTNRWGGYKDQIRASKILGFDTRQTLIRPEVASYFLLIYNYAQSNCTGNVVPILIYPGDYENAAFTEQEQLAFWRANSHLQLRCGMDWVRIIHSY